MHPLQEAIGSPEIKISSEGDRHVRVEVAPLPDGYGMTLGNAFRRVLLSSLPGAAIVAIKIKGASHEYMTLKGVRDSVLDIILNIKSLRIIKHNAEPVTLKLKVKKEGKITAKDIKTPAEIDIVNKDQYLFSIDNKSTEVEMEFLVKSGVGYQPATEQKDLEENMVAIDALFSPIRNVRYEVTDTRVGEITNLDKLTIEIDTDGTYNPYEAFKSTSNILKFYFGLFDKESSDYIDQLIADTQAKKTEDKKEEKEEEPYTPIEILALSPRTLNALLNGQIDSVEKLEKMNKRQLGNLKGFGKKAMDEVVSALKKLGKEIS